jgi:autotransporter-associated beta strand protein
MNTRLVVFLILTSAFILDADADSATWSMNPSSGDWHTAANWTPPTVPDGPADVATFATSNLTEVTVAATSTEIELIVFNSGASAFNITVGPESGSSTGVTFNITGAGIANNSGIMQSLTAGPSLNTHIATIDFQNAASAGDQAVLTVYGAGSFGTNGSEITFHGNSTAATATLVSYGALVGHDVGGGVFLFYDHSTAEEASFILNGALHRGGFGGGVGFNDESSAGNAVFVINAPVVDDHEAGGVGFRNNATAANGVFTLNGATSTSFVQTPYVIFGDSATAGNGFFTLNGGQRANTVGGSASFSGFTFTGLTTTAGNATFINNGGNGANAFGGGTSFGTSSTAAQARLVANGGEDGGGGGRISFSGDSEGGEAQVELFGNGSLDISSHLSPSVTIGSLEGDGAVKLGVNELAIGSNNLSTIFAGDIQDSGSVRKRGTGRLMLSGANTYTGGSTIEAGELAVNNKTGSGTGTGPVQVNAGILSGRGAIAGAVTIGTGNGPGAFLAPGENAKGLATLTIQSALSFKADGTYTYKFNTKRPKGDQVIANGVTIEDGAAFAFKPVANKKLTAGQVFTAINNTAATPIAGTFANLADDSTFTIGNNTFQADYQGGDGNDLTLTVIP